VLTTEGAGRRGVERIGHGKEDRTFLALPESG
jgi:hypothetical protein